MAELYATLGGRGALLARVCGKNEQSVIAAVHPFVLLLLTLNQALLHDTLALHLFASALIPFTHFFEKASTPFESISMEKRRL